ncbi:hypothetical protein [Cryobacterium sp.]|uniref:DUF6993 domain-containing protein n=1 Tax=Cryobacterium sp. TaxID=1926290 RepID=UPI0026204193|nr:hypothetical protein [Cryobacterium sp.]MCU1444770.1 hypothetical protein [Cryobacterium sp.]
MARISNGRTRPPRTARTWAAGLVVSLALAGCAGTPAAPSATRGTSATATAAPTPTEAAAPALTPAGGAAENLAYFDSVIAAILATEANPPGRTVVDALAGAGFDKTGMQVTADTTTEGKPVDSIQFSVRFNGKCLVGQNGPSSGGYHSAVTPLLGNGACLVGATRQIDW